MSWKIAVVCLDQLTRKNLMHDVVTIGSALVDIFIRSDEFSLSQVDGGLILADEYQEKLPVDSFVVTTGGGGSNTGVGFSRMGFKTTVLTELGQDTWSEIVDKDLQKEGVVTDFLVKERKEETGGSVILLAKDKEQQQDKRIILTHRGASSMLDPYDIPDHILLNSDWIHLSSISGQIDTIHKIFSLVSQHQKKISWNPGGAEIELLISGKLSLEGMKLSILFVNQAEWEKLSPVKDQLLAQSMQVVVTKGADGGVIYQHGRQIEEFSGSNSQVVDSTGAGDSFAVGYVSAILREVNPQLRAMWGQKNAVSVINQIGAKAGLLSKEELEKVV